MSIVTDRPDDADDTLPAVSVCVAEIEYTPAANVVNVHDTDNDATEPTTHVEPPVAVNVTDPPVSPTVAFTVGVVSFVTRSELLEPESLDESRANADGTEGAVASRVIVDVDVAAEAGPEFPAVSATDVTFRRGWTVPSDVHVAVTVKVVPDEALTPNVHDAVPALSKSLPASPDTAASIDNVNATDAELVGDNTAEENDDTDGAVVSIVNANAVADVCVVNTPSNDDTATARTAYEPAANTPVVQVQSPLIMSAEQVEPVSVHVPLDGLVPAAAVESWTTEPIGEVPESVTVVRLVMLSVGDEPVSESTARSGSDTPGMAYRTMTVPDPPSPPAAEPEPPPDGLLQYPPAPPPPPVDAVPLVPGVAVLQPPGPEADPAAPPPPEPPDPPAAIEASVPDCPPDPPPPPP